MIRGRRELLAIAQRTRQREIAARCRVHKSRVSKWLAGVTRPCDRARRALEYTYGIASCGWVTGR